jgi:hypothetical protein
VLRDVQVTFACKHIMHARRSVRTFTPRAAPCNGLACGDVWVLVLPVVLIVLAELAARVSPCVAPTASGRWSHVQDE